MKRQFQLARLDSGPDKGKVALCAGDVTLGTIGKKFELRKMADGVGVFANGEQIGTLDEGSLRLVNWPLDNDDDKNDDNARESPTDIGARQHVKKIKEQHLTLTEFQQGMSLEEVARQFGFVRASDQTFIRTVDDTPSGQTAVDVIEPLAGPGGPWEHRLGTDTLNRVRGDSPKELFDHLEFVASDYHDGRQLSLFLRRHLHLVENLDDELGAAVIRRMFDTRCDFTQALREVRPELWDRHREQQTILLID